MVYLYYYNNYFVINTGGELKVKKTFIYFICLYISLCIINPIFAEEDVIKIGALFSVSGRTSFLGIPEKETVEMLTKQINANGGINGKKLEVIIYDTKGDATNTLYLAKKLINEDNVVAIVGPTLSGTSLAIVDLVNQKEIPLISCAASIKIVEPVRERKWVFKTAQSDRIAVQKIYSYLKKNGLQKIAFLTVENAFGKSGQIQLETAAASYGFNIVANNTFSPNTTDIKKQLSNIKKQDPKAIICWGTNPGPAYVAKNMKELQIDTLLIQSHGVASKKFIELAGDACEGNILPAGRLLVCEKLDDNDPQKTILLKYKKDFTEKYGKDPDTFGGHGYDAFMILIKAIEKAGPNRSKIRKEIEKMNFTGISGVFQFSKKDHNGLTEDAFTIVTIKDGNWALLE
ncbi:MAG: ABC transporter substrate-binding protein [Candidatus Aureabacteria bacterium]|nr:ABC transporter substrate-binding protein [Candidatus Auribacterota bacterium]